MAPVNRIPSEILALIPDSWDEYGDNKDRDLVALTHVCRAWREVFISRSTLWTDLDCVGEARTRVYLERSNSLPLNLSLRMEHSLPPCHPSSRSSPALLDDSNPCPSGQRHKSYNTLPLTYLTPLYFSRSFQYTAVILVNHILTSHPHSSTEISLHCVR